MNVPEIEKYVQKKKVWNNVTKVRISFVWSEDNLFNWEINNNSMKIFIDEYLSDMPDKDTKIFMDMLIKSITDDNYNIQYDKIDYICSHQVAIDKQQGFIERVKAGPILTKGDFYDLEIMANGLIRRGLLDPSVLKDTVITYVDNLDEKILGAADIALRIVRINYDLDDDHFPLFAVESILLHELLHIEIGLKINHDPHGEEFKSRMRQYDNREELLKWGRDNSESDDAFREQFSEYL
jgi:hypothetical protein